jgi:hypothetical protein
VAPAPFKVAVPAFGVGVALAEGLGEDPGLDRNVNASIPVTIIMTATSAAAITYVFFILLTSLS